MNYERLMERVIPEPNSGCWLWTGAVNRDGYGRIRIGSMKDGTRGMKMAHRLLGWEQHCGPIPLGQHVLHKCDVPCCVNPQHLFLGTDLDNHRDKARKGRAAQKLTPNDVLAIRALAKTGMSHDAIGKKFGITQANASKTISGKSWSHIQGDIH